MSNKLAGFERLNKLGQGSFGVVYKVRRKKDRQIYVLKQIDFSRMGRAQRNESLRETLLMNKLRHQYIVEFVDSFQDENKLNIIMEFCENGDLGILLKKQMG